MATELERLEALIKADVATEEDKKRYAELTAGAEAPPTPAPAVATETVSYADAVDLDAFKRGGQQYYMPSEEGFWKSKLVETFKPEYTEKEQRWFVLKTDDPKLKAQGRGVIQAEFGKGAFKEKDVLDGLAIPYQIVGSEIHWKAKFPISCYADWSKDSKATGGVRISGLRTLEAGAAVEKAI